MSKILKLLDQLLASSVQKNLYTNESPFSNTTKTTIGEFYKNLKSSTNAFHMQDRAQIYDESRDFQANTRLPQRPEDTAALKKVDSPQNPYHEGFQFSSNSPGAIDQIYANSKDYSTFMPPQTPSQGAEKWKGDPEPHLISREGIYNGSKDYQNPGHLPRSVHDTVQEMKEQGRVAVNNTDSKLESLYNGANEERLKILGNSYVEENNVGAQFAASKPLTSKPVPLQGSLEKRGEDSFFGGNIYDNRSPNPIKYEGKFGIGPTYGLEVLDPIAATQWLRNISREFGIVNRPGDDLQNNRGERVGKFIAWIAKNQLLSFFNPGDPQVGGFLNQIFNPLSLPLAAMPIVRSFTQAQQRPTMAGIAGLDYDATRVQDRMVAMRNGTYVKAPDGDSLLFRAKLIGASGFSGDISDQSSTRYIHNQGTFDILGIPAQLGESDASLTNLDSTPKNLHNENNVDAHIAPLSKLEAIARKNLEIQADALGNDIKNPEEAYKQATLIKTKRLFRQFEENRYGYNPIGLRKILQNSDITDTVVKPVGDYGQTSARILGLTGEEEDGLFSEQVPNENLYMPFFFQDLRRDNKYLYFRAYLKPDFTETFSPEWQTERYFGRVDQIPFYIGTTRTITLAFDMIASTPVDLPVMYRKMHELAGMVYPSFDSEGYMKNAPIIRMRVGDLFSAGASDPANMKNSRGLTGYLTNLDFNFSETTWNVEPNMKVPRKVTVNIAFTVIHEQSPGLYRSGGDSIFGVPVIGEKIVDVTEEDLTTAAAIADIKEEDFRGNMNEVVKQYKELGLLTKR